jgi:hypothetical protein
MRPVTFDSEADEEFRAAAAYYEGQQAGLGDDFVREVEQAVQRIAQTPQAFPLHGSPDCGGACSGVFLTPSSSLICRTVSGSWRWRTSGGVRDTGPIGNLEGEIGVGSVSDVSVTMVSKLDCCLGR